MTLAQLLASLLPWAVLGWTLGNLIGWLQVETSTLLPLPTRIWHWVWYRWKPVLGVWIVTLLIMYFVS